MADETATRMHCPTCEDQTLETLTFHHGKLERCPSCCFFLVEQKTLAALSEDRTQFIAWMDEAKSLLLPIARFCPRCYQKLSNGRLKNQQIILTLCVPCASLWIDFQTLRQFDDRLARTLQELLDYGTPAARKPGDGSAPISRIDISDSTDDKGLGKIIRGAAFFLNRTADNFAGTPPKNKPAVAKKPKEGLKSNPLAPQAAMPKQKLVESHNETKKELVPEIPEIPTEMETPFSTPAVDTFEPEMKVKPMDPVPKVKISQPEPMTVTPPTTPKPDVVIEPPVIPVVEMKPILPPIPDVIILKQNPVRHVPTPPPVAETATFPQDEPKTETPAIAASNVQPDDEVRRLLMEQMSPQPVVKTKAKEMIVKKASASVSNPVKPDATLSKKNPIKELFALFKPIPKSQRPVKVSTSKPVSKPERVDPEPIPVLPMPVEKAVEPVVSKPVVLPKAKPVPKEKPVKVPRVPKEKKPRAPFMDHAAAWMPRVMPILAVGINLLQGDDFDAAIAMCWVFAGWSVGYFIRLLRLYPFKSGDESSVQECLQQPTLTRWHGVPVERKGRFLLDQSMKGSKPGVRFSDGTVEIAVNRIAWWELAPRFLGVSDLARLVGTDVTLTGWFRGGKHPFVEIKEVRTEKTTRKSLVRALRWAFAVLVFLVTTLIILSE